MPFVKRKKRPEISSPTNFVHRVHSDFDHSNGVFVGLPTQWNSIINETEQQKLLLANGGGGGQGNIDALVANLKSLNANPPGVDNFGQVHSANVNGVGRGYRPKPIVDPSRITPTELTCFKVSVASIEF